MCGGFLMGVHAVLHIVQGIMFHVYRPVLQCCIHVRVCIAREQSQHTGTGYRYGAFVRLSVHHVSNVSILVQDIGMGLLSVCLFIT